MTSEAKSGQILAGWINPRFTNRSSETGLMPNIAEACSRVTASGTMAAGPELFLQGSYRGLRIVNPLRVPHLAGYAEQMLSLEVQNIGQWDESLAAQSKTGEPSLAKEATDTFGMPSPAGGKFCRG